MSIFLSILIGLGLAAIGFFFVWKTRKWIDVFGTIDWADQKLGGGGTMLVYKTLGLVFIFIGFIVATGMWDSFLEATIGSLLPKETTRAIVE